MTPQQISLLLIDLYAQSTDKLEATIQLIQENTDKLNGNIREEVLEHIKKRNELRINIIKMILESR